MDQGCSDVRAGSDRAAGSRPAGGRAPLRSFRSAVSQQPQRGHARARRQSRIAARRRRVQADHPSLGLWHLQRVVSAQLRRSVFGADDDYQQVKPERFTNNEVGAKWDVVNDLSITTAVYRLDRTNTRSTDPDDPARIVQTGSQRTNGYEFVVNGRIVPAWNMAGGYAYQDAVVTSATTAARTGAQVGQVPHHMVSLWNNYQLHPRLRAALGVLYRSDMFATIDDTVTLPGYTAPMPPRFCRSRSDCGCRSISRTSSTTGTTSTLTTTRTSRQGLHGPFELA